MTTTQPKLRWNSTPHRKNKYDIVADVTTSAIGKVKGRFRILKTPGRGMLFLELHLNGNKVTTGGLNETERLKQVAEDML